MENLITWNMRNWITVFLMFLAGWAVISLGIRVVKGPPKSGAATQDQGGGANPLNVMAASRVGEYTNG